MCVTGKRRKLRRGAAIRGSSGVFDIGLLHDRHCLFPPHCDGNLQADYQADRTGDVKETYRFL